MSQDLGQSEDVALTNPVLIGWHILDPLQHDTVDLLYPTKQKQQEWLGHLLE
jgi:hypothetical protein